MSGSSYITGTSHAQTLRAALTDLQHALTRRWRELVCAAIVADSHDFPTRFKRSVSAHNHTPLWQYWSLPARIHLSHGCAFVEWVNSGQGSALSAVTCDGATGVHSREHVELVDTRTGEPVTIPSHIQCGVGSVFAQVQQWAWGECDRLFYRLPMFDSHDMHALRRAHDGFVRAGNMLGLQAAAGSAADVAGSFSPMGERDIPADVSLIASRDADGQDWWAGWTGLAASRARSGFFASVAPALNNQSAILGCLANLFSDRAAIIEKGRNDALYWIQWATKSLDATVTITTERTNGWKVVQGIGTAITITTAWSAVGGAVNH